MRVLIISDTHGRTRHMEEALSREPGVKLIIHLGDMEGVEDLLEALAPCPVEMVCGNNDFYTGYPREKVITIGHYRVLLCHGHFYGVSMGTQRLADAALAQGCAIAMFGHTHCPLVDESGAVTLINPGSLTYPRQENLRPSYILMELDREGRPSYTIKYL